MQDGFPARILERFFDGPNLPDFLRATLMGGREAISDDDSEPSSPLTFDETAYYDDPDGDSFSLDFDVEDFFDLLVSQHSTLLPQYRKCPVT